MVRDSLYILLGYSFCCFVCFKLSLVLLNSEPERSCGSESPFVIDAMKIAFEIVNPLDFE